MVLFDATERSSNISHSPTALPLYSCITINFFGVEAMTHHAKRLSTNSQLIHLICGVAVVLASAFAAIAQPATGTVKTLTLKSTVMGEERRVLVRTPAGYETNNVKYPVLYMTDGD